MNPTIVFLDISNFYRFRTETRLLQQKDCPPPSNSCVVISIDMLRLIEMSPDSVLGVFFDFKSAYTVGCGILNVILQTLSLSLIKAEPHTLPTSQTARRWVRPQ